MGYKYAILWISIIGTVLAFALGVIGWLKKDEPAKPWLFRLAVGLMAVVVLANIIEKALSYYAESKDKSIAATSGKLKPITLLQHDERGPFVQVQIGENGGCIRFRNVKPTEEGFFPLFRFINKGLGDSELKVRQDKQGRLLVSVSLRDSMGSIVARISESEWQVNPNMAFDRNYTADAFEVVDQRGEVLLQLRLRHDRIQLQARFFDAHGHEAILGGGMIKGFSPPEERNSAVSIRPMFKYPSALHLGEKTVCDKP